MLIPKTGWDYNGKRESFFGATQSVGLDSGFCYTFADGTSAFREYEPSFFFRSSVDIYEGIYFSNKPRPASINTMPKAYWLPILNPTTVPSFSFGFSWGISPVPLLF